jgi:tetratricopeptide (TPR) repeat protein
MLDAVSHYCMAYREPVTWKPKTAEEITAMWRRIPSAPDQETVARLATAVCAAGKSAAPVAMPKADPLLLRTIVELASGAAPEKVAKWRHAVDAAYDWTDRLLGEVMASMDADTTLLVLSDHGFASGGDLPKPAPGDAARPRSRAPKPPYDSSFNSHLGGASYHRENGVLGVFGKGVRKGFDIPLYDRFREGCGARLLDMAPTTLALLGFPKPKDMPGRVLSEVFDLDLATGSVTTYEVGRSARLAKERVEREEKRRTLSGGEDPLEEGELDTAMRGLAAVGYVGTAEDAPVRAMMNMAASYVQQERWAEAEEAFREALKAARGQQRWDIMVRVGQMRVRLGDLSGARREFEETVRASKAAGQENVLALIALAELADKTGSGEAVALRQRIVELVPDDPYMKIRLADAMRQAAATSPTRDGDLRKAIALIRDAVRPEKGGEPDLEKLGPGGHNALGMALLDSGDFDGAIREFTLADSTATDRKEVYLRPRNNLAVTHMRLAQRDFVAVEAEDDPGKKEALKKGFAEHRAEALRWFDGVLAIDPGNAKAHYNRAEVFLGFPPQDPAAAEKELEAALATDPDYRRARKLLDGLRKAMGKAPPGGDGAPPAPPK